MSTEAVHRQSVREEIANSVSHGVGFVCAAAATPLLILAAAQSGSALKVVGVSIFAVSMVLLYFISMMYHALPRNRAKRVFQILDHAAIFILIAGTYTPFTFGILRGALGWSLFGIVWTLAVAGVIMKSTGGLKHPILSNCIYLGMGWLILVGIRPLWQYLPVPGLVLLAAGGLAYTGGIVFYQAERMRYSHFVWHLFVLTGTVCHFSVIYLYCC